MIFCVFVHLILSFMGLFSPRYRELSKQSYQCLKTTMLMRPCEVGLDNKVKTRITAKLMFFPPLARFFYRHFKAFLRMMDVLFFGALLYFAYIYFF